MATTYSHSTRTARADNANIRAAAGVNDAMLLVGRIVIAIIFLMSGIEKFMGLGETTAEIASKNLPVPNILAIAAAAAELGGGLLVVVGFQTRLAALGLALYTAIAAYFFHDFWHYPAGAEHTDNMIHFMKNMSIIGGFLMLAAAGAGRYSFDGPCIRPELLKR
ncbi:MAG TPA: DoxX family protein [Pseudolabrys sp.]|jgi:putative oxidoreductase|nr:DoxX family protein [Pseudolabrys sp.]